jgi:PAS domain S-box-containing protein
MVSGLALFVSLFNNLALLIILVAVYGILREPLRGMGKVKRALLLGLLFGVFVIGCMQVRIPAFEGVYVDQRNAFVYLAGAFGGPIAAIVAAAAGAIYRVALGGQGILGGILGLGLSCVAGSIVFTRRSRIDRTWKAAVATVTAVLFILPGFLPVGTLREGWALMKAMALPYGSAIAVGIFAGGLLLANEERRHDAQAALRASEAEYRGLFENLVDVSYRTDADSRILIISPSCEAVLGYKPEELVGKDATTFYPDATRREEIAAFLDGDGTVSNYETELVRKDGARIVVSTNARAIRDASGRRVGVDGMLRDITPLKRAEAELKAAVAEREALLMELYHRTNNNMQVISSFLKLQAEALGDPKVDALAQSVSARIHAMSLVYEKLYRSKSLSRVNAREYVEELLPLVEAYGGAPEDRVRIELDVEDLELVIDSAVPLGLVLGEIVGNSFRHAFPDHRKGTIRIALGRIDERTLLLEASDDGVGLPPGFDPYTTSSFGISTMFSIARLQMRGTVEVRSGPGLSYRITMRDRLYEERV